MGNGYKDEPVVSGHAADRAHGSDPVPRITNPGRIQRCRPGVVTLPNGANQGELHIFALGTDVGPLTTGG